MPERKTSPKWNDLRSVIIAQCRVTRSSKAKKGSSRVVAERPSAWVQRLSKGEDGEAMHWLRRFADENGTEFVHGSYHTLNAKGNVAYGQFGSWLTVKEAGELMGAAFEKGVVNGTHVLGVISPRTLVRSLKAMPLEYQQEFRARMDSDDVDLSYEFSD